MLAESASPKVSVCVIAYNHAKSIGACLQSILDQDTDFTFEVVVGDDCSSDGTQEILREYASRFPGIVRPIFQSSNTGGGPNFLAVHAAARGQFIAHVDGDDYALPGKLQAQVNYLESHPECNLVWHRVAYLRDGEDVRAQSGSEMGAPLIVTKADCLAVGSFAVHSSKMYRASLRASYVHKIRHQYDYEMDLLQIEGGTGAVLPDVLGVYRISAHGLSSAGDGRSRRSLDEVLDEQFSLEPQHRGRISAFFLMLALVDLKNRRSRMWRSLRNYLTHFSPASLFYLVRYAPLRYRLWTWRHG